MTVYTKRAAEVYAPTNADGSLRGADLGEALVYHTEVEANIVAAAAGMVVAVTWAGLNAIAGTRAGQPGRVTGADAGTHTDPVVGGTVANVGEYAWSLSPAGWRRVGDYYEVDAATIADIYEDLALKAPLASPTLSGNPTAPTQAAGNNSTRLATTGYADRAIVNQATAYQPGYDSGEPGPFVVVSADGYILQEAQMQEEYDSGEAAPAVVVSKDGYLLSEIGAVPALPAIVNVDQIRRMRQKQRMILRDSTQVLRLAFVGDSWFASYLPVLVRDRLVSIFGDAGPGWVNVSDSNNNKCADSRVSVAKSGTWTDVTGSEPMPSTTAMETSDTGAYMTVFGVGAIATAWLHYVAAGGATGFYRWGVYDGSGSTTDRTNYVFGSDHSLDLSTGYKIAMLTDAPASGNWALEFGRSAGTIKIGGVDLRSGTGGVIVDTLAKGGSNTGFWLTPDKNKWQTAVGSLDIDGTFICLGTNDQAGVVTDLQIARNLDALRQRLVAAEPSSDVTYISPCENFLGRARLMKDITAALRLMALQTGTPHVDLQPSFGPLSKMADYRSTGVRPLFNVDDVHPDSFTGMVVIADVIERLIIQ